MKLAELQDILTQADPAAVLVSPRVLERVVQEQWNLSGFIWSTPHTKCFLVDRHVLFRHVEQEDLILQSHQLLPSKVVLLARPRAEELGAADPGPMLLDYWRRLFHAKVHSALEERISRGELGAAEIRGRIHEIGWTEFAEIRQVLYKDSLLPDGADDRDAYVEFAAVFLERSCFAPDSLAVFFPAVRDLDAVAKILQRDVNEKALFKNRRPAGAPDPAPKKHEQEYESHEYFFKLLRAADRAAEAHNGVKAAILRTRAARVAPARQSPRTRAAAESEMEELTERLRAPLQFSEEQSAELLDDLKKLLDKADQGQQPVEASLLYDLQNICRDNEREIYALSPVDWLLSGGKKPIKRPLPSQRMVYIIRHLRSAIGRLTSARITDADRDELAALLQWALENSEEKLREQFRPILSAAMEDVGLRPNNPPERTAFNKMLEEFLDSILDSGFVTFGDLRDTISRNQLKLSDLTDPQDFIQGDPLLRLDRRLAAALDGVYRPSEIYMRWLERLTALNFGTRIGRAATLFVTLPIGGAFVLVEGVKLIIDHFYAAALSPAVDETAAGVSKEALGKGLKQALGSEPAPFLDYLSLWYWIVLAALSVLFLALLHSRWLRQSIANLGTNAFSSARHVLIELPVWLVTVPTFQQFMSSWPVQLSYWYVLKPGLVCALIYLAAGRFLPSPWYMVGIFLLASVLLNTRPGRALTDMLYQGVLRFANLIREGLLAGVVHLIVAVFKQLTHFVEFILFKVDERLRFRGGDSRTSLVTRTILSIIWYPISFFARFYFIVLIEPCINPLKFPISTIAGKLLYPTVIFPLTAYLTGPASPLRESWLGVASLPFVWLTMMLLPDMFGFLVWETKENWSLYRANRSEKIGAVAVGKHGETITGLLRPGFHSGTIPRLYARLRQAEEQSTQTGNWRVARAVQSELHEVNEKLRQFLARELISLVHQCAAWRHKPLRVGPLRLASNRIEVALVHADHPKHPLRLNWEWRGRWLLAGIQERGWLENIEGEAYWSLLAGLIYLNKLAGVQLVHEQIQAALPEQAAWYDVDAADLRVWSDGPEEGFILYPLHVREDELTPVTEDGERVKGWPVLTTEQLLFSRQDLTWKQLGRAWTEEGESYRELADGAIILPVDRAVRRPHVDSVGEPA